MVPAGREAEFFGVYFVAIKATSWLGPLATAVLNELTGSLRIAILSSLAFYATSLLVMAATDFGKARDEAVQASLQPAPSPPPRPPPVAVKQRAPPAGGRAGPREPLLVMREAEQGYGTGAVAKL